MPSTDARQPFLSPKNIPLWICVILALTFAILGVAHNQPAAAGAAAAAFAAQAR